MSFKRAAIRSAVIIGIVVLSVLFGVIIQSFSDRAERSNYPLKYEEFVKKYSYEYGVPQNVIYAVIKEESGFDSSLLDDGGEIGLMKVSPKLLESYKIELRDSYDTGMLYDPETNIKYGVYHLSKIYLKVGTWRAAFASLKVGTDKVLEWLASEDYAETSETSKPKLKIIPDNEAKVFTERLEETAERYKQLYFED